MAHPVPKELKGQERIARIPYINVYLNKKGAIYCGLASFIAAVLGKMFGIVTCIILFILLNGIAYPAAQMKTSKGKFEGGNIEFDKYFIRKARYEKFKRNLYVRKRVN